ncbi:TPA: conjugal transfer protein [Yersinia enterocolitica]|nr:conjugal transfer protein [Yersinia enterocolitica]
MKNMLIAVSLLTASGYAMADSSTTANPDDPCTIVMCMAGKVMGASGGSDCDKAITNFYSINSFKKHHRFDASSTSDLRKKLLGNCPSADPSTITGIIEKFGRVKG